MPASAPPGTPESRERRAIRSAMAAEKLATAALPAMRDSAVDAWITIDRENRSDPVHVDFGDPYSGAGAATLLFDRGALGLEAVFVGPLQPADSVVARAYQRAITTTTLDETLSAVAELVRRRTPARIAVNRSAMAGAADGLTAALDQQLQECLGPAYARVVSSANVVHAFRADRQPLERKWHIALQRWTATLQQRALTEIVPGRTTALDLACAYQDAARAAALGLATNHGRYAAIVWLGDSEALPGLAGAAAGRQLEPAANDPRAFLLQPGDLVTLDGGLRFLGLSSDVKRSAYLLRPGETEPPESLRRAWLAVQDAAERHLRLLQPGATRYAVEDALLAELRGHDFEGGVTSDRLLADARVRVYGHAIGNAVHDIGPRLGREHADTAFHFRPGGWFSVEFHLVVTSVDAPGGAWVVRFEHTAEIGPSGGEWLVPPQEHLLLIAPRPR